MQTEFAQFRGQLVSLQSTASLGIRCSEVDSHWFAFSTQIKLGTFALTFKALGEMLSDQSTCLATTIMIDESLAWPRARANLLIIGLALFAMFKGESFLRFPMIEGH